MSLPYSHKAMRWLWCLPVSRLRTPCGLPMKREPTLCSTQKLMSLSASLVAQITYTPLRSAADLVLRPLQLLPTAGVLLAPRMLLGDLPQLPGSLSFQRADTAPGHDQGLSPVGGHGCQMDFTEVNRGLNSAGGFFCLWDA